MKKKREERKGEKMGLGEPGAKDEHTYWVSSSRICNKAHSDDTTTNTQFYSPKPEVDKERRDPGCPWPPRELKI